MKKLYTLALAAIVTVSASAAGLQLKQDLSFERKASQTRSAKILSMKKIEKAAPADRAKTAESYTVDGDYEIAIGDYYFQTSAGPVTDVATITKVGNKLTISCDYFYEDVAASYNPLNGAITFNNSATGQVKIGTTTYAYRFEPFAYTADAGITPESYKASFSSSTGEITFPADHGFSWPVYADATLATRVGYLDIFDVEGLTPTEIEPLDEIQEGQWKTVGTAILEDAWITPSYNYEDGEQLVPSDHPITCELQQSVDNEHLYRLWRPFHDENWALASSNQSKYEGQIVYDISDPDHVVVKPGMPAGFKDANGDFYVYGSLGWQIWSFGSSYDADQHLQLIYDFMEEKGQPFDTFKDGVVTINRSIFDVSAACSNAYTWQDNDYVVSKITMKTSGVADTFVADDNSNAPVEYFNLQGVRIQQPAAGQLVIKRKGSSVEKVLVK